MFFFFLIFQQHEIDIFGIGTNLVTCQKQPALGMVYKLVELESIPRMKCSEEQEKTTLPGKKNVFRIFVNSENYPKCDIITKENESIENGAVVLCRDLRNLKQKLEVKVKKAVKLNEYVWQGRSMNINKNIKVNKID
jgi:nicotinate phosphoribosyltransferase